MGPDSFRQAAPLRWIFDPQETCRPLRSDRRGRQYIRCLNNALNLLTVMGEAMSVGPILLGCRRATHILTPSATVMRVQNMSALAAVDAQLLGV